MPLKTLAKPFESRNRRFRGRKGVFVHGNREKKERGEEIEHRQDQRRWQKDLRLWPERSHVDDVYRMPRMGQRGQLLIADVSPLSMAQENGRDDSRRQGNSTKKEEEDIMQENAIDTPGNTDAEEREIFEREAAEDKQARPLTFTVDQNISEDSYVCLNVELDDHIANVIVDGEDGFLSVRIWPVEIGNVPIDQIDIPTKHLIAANQDRLLGG